MIPTYHNLKAQLKKYYDHIIKMASLEHTLRPRPCIALSAFFSVLLLTVRTASSDLVRRSIEEESSDSILTKESRIIGGWEVSLRQERCRWLQRCLQRVSRIASIFDSSTLSSMKAQDGRYMYSVSLQIDGLGHFCGGTLIAKDVVLTAA